MKKIEKQHVGFIEGMYSGMARNHSDKSGYKEVDWKVVKDYIENNKDSIKTVVVGLAEDWTYTSGEVWNKEYGYVKPEDTSVYSCSSWATPSMEITFTNDEIETFETWKHGTNSNSYFEDFE